MTSGAAGGDSGVLRVGMCKTGLAHVFATASRSHTKARHRLPGAKTLPKGAQDSTDGPAVSDLTERELADRLLAAEADGARHRAEVERARERVDIAKRDHRRDGPSRGQPLKAAAACGVLAASSASLQRSRASSMGRGS